VPIWKVGQIITEDISILFKEVGFKGTYLRSPLSFPSVDFGLTRALPGYRRIPWRRVGLRVETSGVH